MAECRSISIFSFPKSGSTFLENILRNYTGYSVATTTCANVTMEPPSMPRCSSQALRRRHIARGPLVASARCLIRCIAYDVKPVFIHRNIFEALLRFGDDLKPDAPAGSWFCPTRTTRPTGRTRPEAFESGGRSRPARGGPAQVERGDREGSAHGPVQDRWQARRLRVSPGPRLAGTSSAWTMRSQAPGSANGSRCRLRSQHLARHHGSYRHGD